MAVKHKVLTKDGIVKKELTPIKAIKLKCGECSNWQRNEVKNCSIADCSLYPFRMGKNPSIKRNLTELQLEKLRENLKRVREHRQNKIENI